MSISKITILALSLIFSGCGGEYNEHKESNINIPNFELLNITDDNIDVAVSLSQDSILSDSALSAINGNFVSKDNCPSFGLIDIKGSKNSIKVDYKIDNIDIYLNKELLNFRT